MVKLALEEWCYWLEGAEPPFTVWTDQKNLAYIQTAKQLNSHHARWALFLATLSPDSLALTLTVLSSLIPSSPSHVWLVP